MNLARNSIANGVAGVATTLAGVLSTIAIARLLGVEGTGVVAFAVWVVTFALLAADLGVPGTLTRYVSAARAGVGQTEVGPAAQPSAIIAALWRPYVLANGLMVVALLAYAASLAVSHPERALAVGPETYRTSALFWGLIAAACLAQALANFTFAALRGLGRFWHLAAVAAISAGVQVATTLIGALTLGIAGAFLGAIVGFLLPAVMAGRFHETGHPPLPADLSARMSRYALEAWFGFIVTAFAWSRMEVVFLERSFGSEAVGLYTAGLTMANVATQGPLLFTGALLPFLSAKAAAGEFDALARAFDSVLRLFTLAVAPACLGLAAISAELLPLIFGEAFGAATPVAVVLLVTASVTVCASLSTIYLLALERTRFVLVAASVGAVLVVAAGVLVVPVYGEMGAAVARALIQLLVVGAGLWYVVTRLATPIGFARLGLILLSAALNGLAAHWVASAVGGVLGVALAVPVGVAVYALAIRLTGALDAADAGHIEQALASFPTGLRGVLQRVVRLLVRRSG